MNKASIAFTAALLAGCASTELPPARSTVATPATFIQAASTAAEPVPTFWRAFGDATLDRLVEQAVVANTDLRIAAARVAEARALAEGTEGLGRPTLGLSAGAGRLRSPDANGNVDTRNNIALGLETRWELDLFGRVEQTQRAAGANLAAAQALQRGVQVSVAAEVASQYFQLRGLQARLDTAQQSLEGQQQALKLVQARLDVGRGTALDTERAKALVAGTAATVPALESALARTRMRLAVLGGGLPSAYDGLLAAPSPLPGLPPTALASIGAPEDLLRRRPDVAAAEQQLRAAEADAGVARSQRYPSLTLGGTLGLNAGSIGALGNAASFVYNLGANLLWSAIDQGRRESRISAADARRDAALARFDQAVLGALEDTESALVGYTRAQRRSEQLLTAAQAAEKAARIATARFDAGSSDFLAVLDAERERLAARDRLDQSQTEAAVALVGVYRALAGGW